MTWLEVVRYFERNYNMQYDSENQMITLTLEFTQLERRRTQLVMLEYVKSQSGKEYVTVYSRAGTIPQSRLNEALQLLMQKVCGGLTMSSSKPYYYVRNTVPLDGLKIDVLVTTMDLCALSADELEIRFVGGDEQ